MLYIIVATLNEIEFFEEIITETPREAVIELMEKYDNKCEVIDVFDGYGQFALPCVEWA